MQIESRNGGVGSSFAGTLAPNLIVCTAGNLIVTCGLKGTHADWHSKVREFD